MSKADKMFEDLGYEKSQDDEIWICFDNKNESINFCKKYRYFEGIERINGTQEPKSFNIKELQTINEKVKELRME